MPRDTVRLTVAQAIVTYLSRQYSVADGQRRRLIPAALGIFGHGNVAGLGQALDQLSDALPFIQGRNEQALVHVAEGLGARALRATTADQVRAALAETRDHSGPVVIVVPAIPHADLPGAGVWWDVAPAEVAEQDAVARLRAEYEDGLATQRWHG